MSQQNDPNTAGPDIEVVPGSLSLGPVGADATVTQSFAVRNVGTSTLDVSKVVIDLGGEVFTVLTPGPFDVEPNEEHLVEIAFSPLEPITYGQASVHSDDPDEAVVPVPLEGLGEVPALNITPSNHIFPTLCADSVVLTLDNVGLSTLEVREIRYDTPVPDLTLQSDLVLPLTLSPGEQAATTVWYTPVSGSPVAGRFEVVSNDPRGVRFADQSSEASTGVVTEQFEVAENPAIDILFAIDKSGSMTDDARALGLAFGDFIAEVDSVTTGWQIGVVTKDSGCFNNGIITAATPNYGDVFLDAVGGLIVLNEPDLTEALLAMIDVTLVETGPSGCNAGFRRPGALLHIVAVSDEPEQSGMPASHWLTRWESQMSDPNLLVVSVVADVNSSCGSGASGYVEAAASTGGLSLDICNRNWGSFATQLGSASAQGLLTYLLSSLPDPASIIVSVDGTAYPLGWHYDPVRNAVVIDVELPAGALVEITYDSIGC